MEEKYNILPDKVTFRVSDDIMASLVSSGNTKKLRSIFYSSIFRTSDLGSSYRFINNLEAVGLLPNRRRNENSGWRKLNWVEHVYVLIVAELRKYGFKTDAIMPFASAFLDKTNNVALISMLSVMRGIEITLIFKHDGTCAILDPVHVGFYESETLKGTGIVPNRSSGEVQLKLSYFINKLWTNIGLKPIEIEYFFGKQQASNSIVSSLSETEKEAVLRTRGLAKGEKLSLRRKSQKEILFDQESFVEMNDEAAAQLIAWVDGDFGNVSGSVRDGKAQGLRKTKSDLVQDE